MPRHIMYLYYMLPPIILTTIGNLSSLDIAIYYDMVIRPCRVVFFLYHFLPSWLDPSVE